jgi:hypothetical protein
VKSGIMDEKMTATRSSALNAAPSLWITLLLSRAAHKSNLPTGICKYQGQKALRSRQFCFFGPLAFFSLALQR